MAVQSNPFTLHVLLLLTVGGRLTRRGLSTSQLSHGGAHSRKTPRMARTLFPDKRAKPRPHAAYLLTAASVARRNWLTFSLESKTCATSGSIKTRTPPGFRPRKCLAKRFGRAFEKSYSARISSEVEPFDRVLRFLVDMTFSSRRKAGADHSNRATSLNKGYHEKPPETDSPRISSLSSDSE